MERRTLQGWTFWLVPMWLCAVSPKTGPMVSNHLSYSHGHWCKHLIFRDISLFSNENTHQESHAHRGHPRKRESIHFGLSESRVPIPSSGLPFFPLFRNSIAIVRVLFHFNKWYCWLSILVYLGHLPHDAYVNPQCLPPKIPNAPSMCWSHPSVPEIPLGQAVDQATLLEQRQVPRTELRQSVQLAAHIPQRTQVCSLASSTWRICLKLKLFLAKRWSIVEPQIMVNLCS